MIAAIEEGLARARHAETDGLRTIVADLPGAPVAVLLFRGGQADETLPTRGTLHLAEHLVAGPTTPLDPLGAQVGVLSTAFVVRGAQDEVRTWLGRVAELIAAPPMSRLAQERRVLDVEGAEGTPSSDGTLMAKHFGAQGPGLTGWRELGLRRVGEREVRATIDRVFTRANAVLALSAPVPGLTEELELPDGPRLPPAVAEPLPLSPVPAEVPAPSPRLAVGGPVAWTPAMYVLRALLERRAWTVLRDEHGLAYDVRCRAYAVAADRRFLVVGGDVRTEDVPRATAHVVDAIARLADGHLDAGALERAKDDLVRQIVVDPLHALHAAALHEAVCAHPWPLPELLSRLRAVTAGEVAAVAAELAGGLLALAPEEPGDVPSGLPRLHPGPLGLGGTTYWAMGKRVARLSVGEAGVSSASPDGRVSNVRFAECVAAVRGPDDELTLVSRDGSEAVIDPHALQDGLDALTRAEAALPDGVFVPADGESLAHEAGARRRRRERATIPARTAPATDRSSSSSGRRVRWQPFPPSR